MDKTIQLNEQIKVMLAFGAGKKIESRKAMYLNKTEGWIKCTQPYWNWVNFEYRIEQEKPVIIWRNKYKTPGINVPHATASGANSSINNSRNRTHLTKEIHYPIVDGIVVGLEDDCD